MICSTEGDAGDCLYLAALLHGLGGQHTILLQQSERTKAKGEDGIRSLCELVIPLLKAQPYIKDARQYVAGDKVEWQSAKFREQGHYSIGETLLGAHRKHLVSTLGLGADIRGTEKWLTAIPDKRSQGKIVINRTARYRNPYMPWLDIVKHYSHRLIFVGLRHEWREFCGHFGYVDFHPTASLLNAVQLIAGSELFIGNQSCAFACAEGLKHPRIQETSLEFPDCIFGGAQYCIDGTVILPDIAGSGERKVYSKAFSLDNVQTIFIPPGGWQYDSEETGSIMTSHVDTCARDVCKRLKHSVTREQATRMVIAHNVARVPRHFSRDLPISGYSRAKAALANAAITSHPILELFKGNVTFNP